MRHLDRPMFLLAVGLCIPLAALGQEGGRPSASTAVDDSAVWSSRGLIRVGYVYLLKEEVDSKEAIKKDQDELKRLEAKGGTLRETIARDKESLTNTEQDLRAQQQQRDNLYNQKQQLNDYLIQNQDPNVRLSVQNQVQAIENQIRTKKDSIDRLNQTFTLAQANIQIQQTSLGELEASYNLQKSSFERRFASLIASYQPLRNDREVIEALKRANRTARPWVMIGPAWEYDNNVKSFAQGILNAAGLEITHTSVSKKVGNRTTKVQVSRASLAKKEKAVRDAGYQARLLETKLSGPQGASNLQKMSAAIDQLKKGIAEVQAAYTELNKDPLFASATTQVAPGATIDPSDDYKNYVKRLPALEKALNTRK